MSQDINSWRDAITAVGAAIAVLKQIKDLLPRGPKKDEFEKALERVEEAEGKLERSDLKLAQELGYVLCHCEWPGHVMTQQPNNNWKCPKCGRIEESGYGGWAM